MFVPHAKWTIAFDHGNRCFSGNMDVDGEFVFQPGLQDMTGVNGFMSWVSLPHYLHGNASLQKQFNMTPSSDQHLPYVSIRLSVSGSRFCPCVSACVSLFVCACMFVRVYLRISLCSCLCLRLSFCSRLSVSTSVSVPAWLCFSNLFLPPRSLLYSNLPPSLPPPIHPHTHPSVRPSIHLWQVYSIV